MKINFRQKIKGVNWQLIYVDNLINFFNGTFWSFGIATVLIFVNFSDALGWVSNGNEFLVFGFVFLLIIVFVYDLFDPLLVGLWICHHFVVCSLVAAFAEAAGVVRPILVQALCSLLIGILDRVAKVTHKFLPVFVVVMRTNSHL